VSWHNPIKIPSKDSPSRGCERCLVRNGGAKIARDRKPISTSIERRHEGGHEIEITSQIEKHVSYDERPGARMQKNHLIEPWRSVQNRLVDDALPFWVGSVG
jgi:hypothetical protein